MERYNRHINLQDIGAAGQAKINQSKVLVIGAGGLGCPVLQYLAAAGIGKLGIIDFDKVERSNLQRQVLFGTSSLGENKALAAQKVLQNLNDTIVINAYPEALTVKNSLALFEAYDIVVDGSDNFAARYLINDTAILTDTPVVYGAIYKFEGQVTVFNYKNGPSYRCLFPKPPKPKSIPNCSETGVLGVLPGIIGALQANEVLKLVLELGQPLSGELCLYNALTNMWKTITIKPNPLTIKKIIENGRIEDADNQDLFCISNTNTISLEAVLSIKNIQFIDVRELHEYPRLKAHNIIEIPLPTLKKQYHNLNTNVVNVFFCQSGVRSKQAVAMVQQHINTNCFSLKVGATALAKALKIQVNGKTI